MTLHSHSKGFTLVELLMVIALIGTLAVLSITPIGDNINEGRFQDTVTRLQTIRDAMLGDPTLKNGQRTSFGYVGDMGGIPTVAQGIGALVTNPGLPVWTLDQTVHFGRGWNGPYLASASNGTNFTVDAWGNALVYSPATSPPTLTSLGADGATG